jgi:hypothetical protein
LKKIITKRAGGVAQGIGPEFKPLYHKKKSSSWAPVAHACNPSFLGGRDQEDLGSKPVQANSSRDPIWKNPSQK